MYDLCCALAALARRLCSSYIYSSHLSGCIYTASRLIPLDKCPGVRPIGVGEVVRRIVGKSVMKVVKPDLLGAVGALQLCAGQDAGHESAVHAMKFIFEEYTTEAMIFVDASNALIV